MREPVTELAGAGATTAEPLWRAATSARVRDLAWCTLAPPLLSAIPREFAALAEPGGAALAGWPPGALAAWQRWLASADPDLLPPTIEELSALPGAVQALAPAARSLRLGRHAERLLHFALEHGEGIELVASNLPVRRHGPHGVQTLGELDFVWRDVARGGTGGAPQGQLVHWEMATKFYLLVEPEANVEAMAPDPCTRLQAFVGPNLVDRLGDKLSHILRRQLPLSRTTEAEALLGARVDRSEIYLLGWLFYRDGVMPAGLDALGLNPAHLRGWWSTLAQWAQRVEARSPGSPGSLDSSGTSGTSGTSASASSVRWHRLPRARWLSPALVPEHETEPFETLHGALAARFAEPHRELAWRREAPVMVCEMEPAGASAPGWWRERSRGFVVPPGWEERARQRAVQPPRC
ncbi:DUF1853 family protein [Cupriavidus cauae]|uniref:DUF1853 family protein n=1 Tax=Cupriavidus cauae TaxID=2608999 RepID=UPI002243986D|nr:DUF1853 family protein [Cupriavidus cauae]UZN48575.1 DUF1853 family protein [Cupriavidus cauae]